MWKIYLVLFTLLFSKVSVADPANFEQAKVQLKQIYQGNERTFYCDCAISWVGRSGGRVDHDSCGFAIYSPKGLPSEATLARAARSEVEHIIPISWIGKQLTCWQNGGRKNCQASDPLFNKIEADLFNLTYAVGQINGLRSDLPFAMVTENISNQFGRCDIKIDTKNRKVQPKADIRGDIARVAFYMADRYNLTLSRQDQQLYLAWHKQDPVSELELLRHNRTAALTQRSNPFVTGEKSWQLGFRTSGVGLTPQGWLVNNDEVSSTIAAVGSISKMPQAMGSPIHGNRNSRVYHRADCPNYSSMAPANRVIFQTSAEAEQQGYRLAGNCPK
ncbi:endonuclease [Alishewanella longhuensis]